MLSTSFCYSLTVTASCVASTCIIIIKAGVINNDVIDRIVHLLEIVENYEQQNC